MDDVFLGGRHVPEAPLRQDRRPWRFTNKPNRASPVVTFFLESGILTLGIMVITGKLVVVYYGLGHDQSSHIS